MPVTVMSANLFNGRTKPGALAAVLDDVRPDILACQELSPNAAAVIAQRLPHGHLEPRDDYHGGGIAASRAVATSKVPLTGRDGWGVRLDPEHWPEIDHEVGVTSVHFTNPIVRPVRNSLEERRGQLADTVAHVGATDVPLLLVGDFNSTPLWPVYRRLAEHIDDGVKEIGAARRTWGPWSWFPRLLRIDHAFVRDLQLSSVRHVRISGMDHSALVVDVSTPAVP